MTLFYEIGEEEGKWGIRFSFYGQWGQFSVISYQLSVVSNYFRSKDVGRQGDGDGGYNDFIL
jgi:hypothetical protein